VEPRTRRERFVACAALAGLGARHTGLLRRRTRKSSEKTLGGAVNCWEMRILAMCVILFNIGVFILQFKAKAIAVVIII
jgi:hypothetical protein